MLSKEQQLIVPRATVKFDVFLDKVFSQSIDVLKDVVWTGGEYPMEIADWMQKNLETMRVSAKDHFKSMSLYAHFMWRLFQHQHHNLEAHYFSYSQSMAAYHVHKIRSAIQSNPYFDLVTDLKKSAEQVIDYTWDGDHHITMLPHGLLDFKRGIHAPLIYVDDPFQDPENKMILTLIEKINKIMRHQILDMSQRELHIVGTAQTNQDFFFDKEFQKKFAFKKLPAILNHKDKKVLWPEWMDWDELMARKALRGAKSFNQEYQVKPAYAEDAYINKAALMALVREKNLPYDKDYNTERDVIGGYDVGRKAHPAHFTVFEEIKGGHLKQLHQVFFDKWPYMRQVKYIEKAIDSFKIDFVYYDATRGELLSMEEQGILPAEMQPVNFSVKTKRGMATELDKRLVNKKISFINDERMLEQMLLVDNDLKAVETPEGHGDSFWSVCLALKHFSSADPKIHSV